LSNIEDEPNGVKLGVKSTDDIEFSSNDISSSFVIEEISVISVEVFLEFDLLFLFS